MIRINKVPATPILASSGLREMEERDVAQVADLYARYMTRFEMVPVMTVEEVRHQFLSGRGRGELGEGGEGRREGQVTWAFVVEVRVLVIHLVLGFNFNMGELLMLDRTQKHAQSQTSFHSTPSPQQSSITQATACWKLRISSTTRPTSHSRGARKTMVS